MERIIKCCGSDRTLTFDAEAQSWAVVINDKVYRVGDGSDQSTLAMLPFLELPVDSFVRAVSEFIQEHPECNFPYETLIRAGFQHGSPHWTDCSLRWLLELKEVEEDFSKYLVNVVEKKQKYSQKSRHLATRLLKRMK